MNIVYVVADTPEEWNSAEWRCAIPARAIQRTRLHKADLLDIIAFAQNTSLAQQLCQAADVIVIQRGLFGPVLNAIQRWKARDKVVIADIDDAYHLTPPSASDYDFWIQGMQGGKMIDPAPLTQFKWGLRLVHAATTPSNQLIEDFRAYVSMHYLPNYMETERYLEAMPRSHDGVIIGWGGSSNHLQSFTDSGVLPALVRVCEARPKVKVMICGDPRVAEELPVPADQKIVVPWVSYSAWPQHLAQFDIGIAPLAGEFDQRRSYVKIMEYMLMKIPWVASDGPAYHSLRSYGWLVQNKPNAWERILLDMVDNLADHQAEAANEPFLYSLSQGIDQNVDKMIAIYQSVLNKNFAANVS